jgi:hypothetical protein
MTKYHTMRVARDIRATIGVMRRCRPSTTPRAQHLFGRQQEPVPHAAGPLTLTAECEKPAGVLRDPRRHVPGESVGVCCPRISCSPPDTLTHIAIAQANKDVSVPGSGPTLTRSVRSSFTTRPDCEHRFDKPLVCVKHYWRCDNTRVERLQCGGSQ